MKDECHYFNIISRAKSVGIGPKPLKDSWIFQEGWISHSQGQIPFCFMLALGLGWVFFLFLFSFYFIKKGAKFDKFLGKENETNSFAPYTKHDCNLWMTAKQWDILEYAQRNKKIYEWKESVHVVLAPLLISAS